MQCPPWRSATLGAQVWPRWPALLALSGYKQDDSEPQRVLALVSSSQGYIWRDSLTWLPSHVVITHVSFPNRRPASRCTILHLGRQGHKQGRQGRSLSLFRQSADIVKDLLVPNTLKMPLDQHTDMVLSQMGPRPVERVPVQQMRQQMGSRCACPQA